MERRARRSGRSSDARPLSSADRSIEVPSLLTRWHPAALAASAGKTPRAGRAHAPSHDPFAAASSPGSFWTTQARGPNIDDDAADDDSDLAHQPGAIRTPGLGRANPPESGLKPTWKPSRGLSISKEQIAVYGEASRNRDIVARVTGEVASSDRDRLFTGFNTPLVPEVLIVTTVGQEGIDLHRECRHVIHHDLPWNPATLEQRTGRVDRIGSKTERLRGRGNGGSYLDVAVPYIAGTYDEHRFRVVHGRAHVFEVTLGGKYAVDGHRISSDPMDAERVSDVPGKEGTAWAPIPEAIATELRLSLEAESPDEPNS